VEHATDGVFDTGAPAMVSGTHGFTVWLTLTSGRYPLLPRLPTAGLSWWDGDAAVRGE
jgi:hypothetical protein